MRTYDHSFKGITDPGSFKMVHGEYSVSRIKSYLDCPFKMLMTKLIPCLDDEKHQLWKGTLIHKVFEYIYEDTFDYEKAFNEGVIAYKNQMQTEGYSFTKKEEIYLELMHKWLEPIVKQVQSEKNNASFEKNSNFIKDFEIEVRWKIGTYNFKGYIDKLLFTKNTESYYTIVDYKTGSHGSANFDPLVAVAGYDIQLPLYYQALKDNYTAEIKNYNLGGFGIKHIYGSTVKDAFYDKSATSKSVLRSNLRIDGLLYNSPDYYGSFGPDNVAKNGSPAGKDLTKSYLFGIDQTTGFKTFVIEYKGFKIEYSIEQMLQDIETRVLEVISKIEHNQYDIAPKYNDVLKKDIEFTSCSYCSYKDICYKNIDDMNDLTIYLDRKFY